MIEAAETTSRVQFSLVAGARVVEVALATTPGAKFKSIICLYLGKSLSVKKVSITMPP